MAATNRFQWLCNTQSEVRKPRPAQPLPSTGNDTPVPWHRRDHPLDTPEALSEAAAGTGHHGACQPVILCQGVICLMTLPGLSPPSCVSLDKYRASLCLSFPTGPTEIITVTEKQQVDNTARGES